MKERRKAPGAMKPPVSRVRANLAAARPGGVVRNDQPLPPLEWLDQGGVKMPRPERSEGGEHFLDDDCVEGASAEGSGRRIRPVRQPARPRGLRRCTGSCRG